MRLSIARVPAGHHTPDNTLTDDEAGLAVHGAVWRRMALALAVVLMLGCVGVLFGTPKSAGADTPTVFQSGQVFASVGDSLVYTFDPASGNQVATLQDDTDEPYTAGSAFDSSGNFYVADDINGDISEFSPTGTALPTFATGLSNPLSMVFDNAGNMYVGQQTTPYIAEFAPDGTRLPDIGPLQTQLYGDDWIDLASDECTFYYTTEGTDILTYNKCTNTQGPTFNKVSFPSIDPTTGLPVNAFELKILAGGDVLVADSNADLLLDPNGNVIQTYPCSSMTNCGGQLFAISVDPSGASFWTGDSASGYIYQINIASGAVMQTINSQSGTLYGLSVDNQKEVATPSQTTTSAPTSLAVQPVSGNFSTPTPVSAVLTNPSTGQPIVNEPITFTLNGAETCTANTDATGTATCVITPAEPSSSYTLTASFSGDTSSSTPEGSDNSSSTFTVSPDTSGVTYTGPTTAVNGQPTTLSGTLTTDTPTPGSPLPTKVVTFTIGTGSTAQSCSGTTDANGNVSCTIPTVAQTQTAETVTTSFAGDSYDTPISTTTPVTVTEPTTLTVNPATSPYSDTTTVSGVLTDTNTNAPISGEPVTFQLNGSESCTGTTDATGTASCSITPGEPAATYTLTGTFPGDSTLPLQLTNSNNSASFIVTPDTTTLTYTGGTVAQNGQPLTVSGVLTNDTNTGVNGQTVTFTLGSGSTAQTCTAVSSSTGAASCVINVTGQPQGPIPVTDTYAGNTYYQSSNASSTVNLPEGTTLTVNPGSGTYNTPGTVSATLINSYTSAPVPNEPVTLVVNGTQKCTATTNASGVASCTVTPNEPGATYKVTGSFGGDTTSTPTLLSSTGSNNFVENKAPTTVTYTGSTSITSGNSPVLSATLTTNGAPLSGQTVTFTVGSGSSAQKCSGTTNSAGNVSCSICMFNQSASPLPVTVTYGGNTYYGGSTSSKSITVTTPTSLSVSAVTGATGQPTTVSGTLTNQVTGQGISGQTVTLTLNGSQSCTATTTSNGKASCSITPNESAGTYTVMGSFAGNTTTSPQLLSSSGHNNFVVTPAATSLTYTGATTATNGSSVTLSSTLTSNGTPLSGQTVTLSLGTGKTAQSCTATTTSSGVAACSVPSVNQVSGSITVTVTYAGSSYYQSSSTTGTVKVSNCGSSGGGSGGSGGSSGGSGSGGGYSEPPPVGGGRGCG
jgi:hypothetical protein